MTAPPPAYSLTDKMTTTYAEAVKATWDDTRFTALHEAFRHLMSSQETIKKSKSQLDILRALGVILFEKGERAARTGGDVGTVLTDSARIIEEVASSVETGVEPDVITRDLAEQNRIEDRIEWGVEGIVAQLKKLLQANEQESTMYKNELSKARQQDRGRINQFEKIIKSQHGNDLEAIIKNSVEENLKIIGDRTVGDQKRVEAKQALAVIAQLTGKSLPPSTLLGKDFVTIDGDPVHRGKVYDILRGKYYTEEQIAIKRLGNAIDEEHMNKCLERFHRQVVIWSSLRHDAILPFYGIDVFESGSGQYRFYMVSPYLQNKDLSNYLKRYPGTLPGAKMQMILDIARGLNYMHFAAELPEGGTGVAHGGLNISNILVKDSGRVVISGFGHSKILQDCPQTVTGDDTEYRYMAPELLLEDPRLVFGSDIWSWSMTALEILSDVPAFGVKTRGPRIISLITSDQRPKRSDHPKLENYAHADDLWKIFEECWDKDPDKRPDAETLVHRLKPMLQQAGRRTSPVRGGQPPAPPEQFGKRDPPVVPGNPLPGGTQPPQQDWGKATFPVARASPDPPRTP